MGIVGKELAEKYGIPCLQLCWRVFPADGGTSHDAINDMLAGIHYMRRKHGQQCGVVLLGYSFGGAAIWAFLAQCAHKPDFMNSLLGGKGHHSWLFGCIALSGALKGPGDDHINLFSALRHLETCHAPLLVIHGSDDDNVSLSAALKLYRQASSLKTLCVLEGADHDLRELRWRELVARICHQWLSHVTAPRGVSSSTWSRSVLEAQHSAAADLCKASLTDDRPVLALQFDPPPQRLATGGQLTYNVYVPPSPPASEMETAIVGLRSRYGRKNESSERSEEHAQRKSHMDMASLWALHARRLQKAREQRLSEHKGSLEKAYSRLQESRQRHNA